MANDNRVDEISKQIADELDSEAQEAVDTSTNDNAEDEGTEEENGDETTDDSTDDSEAEDTDGEGDDESDKDDDTDSKDDSDVDNSGSEDEDQETDQKPDQKQVAREKYQERQQKRQSSNFINDLRDQVRTYQRKSDPEDVQAQLDIIKTNQYIDTVERNRSTLVNDMQRAKDLPIYKDNPDLYNRKLDRFEQLYVQTDEKTGEPIGAYDRNGNPVSVFDYLQQEAADLEGIQGTSKRQAQQAEAKMRAKASNPAPSNTKPSSGDELGDLLDRIGDMKLAG